MWWEPEEPMQRPDSDDLGGRAGAEVTTHRDGSRNTEVEVELEWPRAEAELEEGQS